MSSPVLVVGSVALDTVETPFGKLERGVGGAGTYAAYAASLLAPVRLVGVIGDDFPQATLEGLAARGVDLAGVERVAGGKSFHWAGRYNYDMNSRDTLATDLNVFGDFNPQLSAAYRETPFVFLANIMPALQLSVLEQVTGPRFVMCDTMNLWIDQSPEELAQVLARVDLALMNDSELRQLTETPNLTAAAERVLEMGPRYVVIKKGEYGASLVSAEGHFSLPCYPLPNVVDPTGAGDSFAGGLIGFLAWLEATDEEALRQALACGTVLASACVEGFSVGALEGLRPEDVYRRYEELRQMTQFGAWPQEG